MNDDELKDPPANTDPPVDNEPPAAAEGPTFIDELEVPGIGELVEGFEDVVRDGFHQVAGHAVDFDDTNFEQYSALARQKLEQIFAKKNLVQLMQTGILERAWQAVKSGQSVVRRNRASIV